MARKKTRQTRSEVKLRTPSMPGIPLGKAKWEFKSYHDNKLVGTLEVSKGSVVWKPKGQAAGRTAKFINWNEFAKYMEDYNRAKAAKKKAKKKRSIEEL